MGRKLGLALITAGILTFAGSLGGTFHAINSRGRARSKIPEQVWELQREMYKITDWEMTSDAEKADSNAADYGRLINQWIDAKSNPEYADAYRKNINSTGYTAIGVAGMLCGVIFFLPGYFHLRFSDYNPCKATTREAAD